MWTALKASIQSLIYPNGNQEISGQDTQDALNLIIDNLGEYELLGRAEPSDTPASSVKAIYVASTAGTYTNFDGIIIAAGEAAFLKKENGSWGKVTIVTGVGSGGGGGVVTTDGSSVFGDGSAGDSLRALFRRNGQNVDYTDVDGINVVARFIKEVTTDVENNEFINIKLLLANAGKDVMLGSIDTPTTGFGYHRPDLFSEGDELGFVALYWAGVPKFYLNGEKIYSPLLRSNLAQGSKPAAVLGTDTAGRIRAYNSSVFDTASTVVGSGSAMVNGAAVSAANGDDVEAEYGNLNKPYLSIDIAIAQMQQGDTLYVLDGNHTIGVPSSVLFNIDCSEGTVITLDVLVFLFDALTTTNDVHWAFWELYDGGATKLANDCTVNNIYFTAEKMNYSSSPVYGGTANIVIANVNQLEGKALEIACDYYEMNITQTVGSSTLYCGYGTKSKVKVKQSSHLISLFDRSDNANNYSEIEIYSAQGLTFFSSNALGKSSISGVFDKLTLRDDNMYVIADDLILTAASGPLSQFNATGGIVMVKSLICRAPIIDNTIDLRGNTAIIDPDY